MVEEAGWSSLRGLGLETPDPSFLGDGIARTCFLSIPRLGPELSTPVFQVRLDGVRPATLPFFSFQHDPLGPRRVARKSPLNLDEPFGTSGRPGGG